MRISLRHRLADGRFADVLGVLQAWTDDEVRVVRRDGTVVRVAVDAVVAAKRIPPPPVRRSGRDAPAPRRTPGQL